MKKGPAEAGPYTSPKCIQQELRAAAAGDPDATVIIAPRLSANAGVVAELTREAHAVRRVGRAEGAVAALRLAQHDRTIRGRGHAGRGGAVHGELGAAAVGDPDAVFVIAPVAAQRAGMAADLAAQAHAVRRVHRTMPLAAAGLADQRVHGHRLHRARGGRSADRELGAAAFVDPDSALIDAP